MKSENDASETDAWLYHRDLAGRREGTGRHHYRLRYITGKHCWISVGLESIYLVP